MKTLITVFLVLAAILFYVAFKPNDERRRAALDEYIACISGVLHEPPGDLKRRTVAKCQQERREKLE